MRATQCVWHKACRYQQALTKAELEAGGNGESCWADGLRCNDILENMDTRCKLFLRANRTLQPPQTLLK